VVQNKAFIEEQFPVSLISKESYKERKAGAGQTLTGLGKWWGRKPLILVRAVIIGLLMPASSEPKKDREIFLKILTMDADGLWQRCKGVTAKSVFEWSLDAEKEKYFNVSLTVRPFLSEVVTLS
jgi:putative DNA methylase